MVACSSQVRGGFPIDDNDDISVNNHDDHYQSSSK